MLILFAKSHLRDMDSARKPASDPGSLQSSSSCISPLSEILKHMDDSPNTDIDNGNQSIPVYNKDGVSKQVAADALTQDSNVTFGTVMSKLTSQQAQKYDGKKNQNFILLMLD